jgi:hypothetical protein
MYYSHIISIVWNIHNICKQLKKILTLDLYISFKIKIDKKEEISSMLDDSYKHQ